MTGYHVRRADMRGKRSSGLPRETRRTALITSDTETSAGRTSVSPAADVSCTNKRRYGHESDPADSGGAGTHSDKRVPDTYRRHYSLKECG